MLQIDPPILKACSLVGSQVKMASILEVSSSMVSQMVKGTRPIPADKCPLIERATEGRVRCEDLRPDVDWQYIRGTAMPIPQHQG
jgi:DNA-binding transcriptional regulator YdaS (Cro superfamily)